MGTTSRVILCALVGALIAGCGTAPYRSGKSSNDHEVVYRPGLNKEQERVVKEREVVYVERDPYVYATPAPAYRVVEPAPTYRVVPVQPTYRMVPVTRYYYIEQ